MWALTLFLFRLCRCVPISLFPLRGIFFNFFPRVFLLVALCGTSGCVGDRKSIQLDSSLIFFRVMKEIFMVKSETVTRKLSFIILCNFVTRKTFLVKQLFFIRELSFWFCNKENFLGKIILIDLVEFRGAKRRRAEPHCRNAVFVPFLTLSISLSRSLPWTIEVYPFLLGTLAVPLLTPPACLKRFVEKWGKGKKKIRGFWGAAVERDLVKENAWKRDGDSALEELSRWFQSCRLRQRRLGRFPRTFGHL